MNPKHRKQIENYREKEKEKSAVVKFVELNTKRNITIKREFLYLEDVKLAININTLEERRNTKLKILQMIKKSNNFNALIQSLEKSADLDRHRLIKMLKI